MQKSNVSIVASDNSRVSNITVGHSQKEPYLLWVRRTGTFIIFKLFACLFMGILIGKGTIHFASTMTTSLVGQGIISLILGFIAIASYSFVVYADGYYSCSKTINYSQD